MHDKFDAMQAADTADILKLPVSYIHKDFYVTQAIHTLMQIHNDYYELVFQGGTSVSKGYCAIERLSEDIDFRVIAKAPTKSLGKEAQRKQLRQFRRHIVQTLEDNDFTIPIKGTKVYYEGRYMGIQAQFPNPNPNTYLKPHIAIECFVGELILPPQEKYITTLVKTTLGDQCHHQPFNVVCVAPDETAAEKWVALTRRVANTAVKTRPSDKQLVRHLYDLYHLSKQGLLTGDYRLIANRIMEKDRQQFKKHNESYVKDPLKVSIQALDMLFQDKKWEGRWDDFLTQMVYEKNKPSFNQAYGKLIEMSHHIKIFLKEKSKNEHDLEK